MKDSTREDLPHQATVSLSLFIRVHPWFQLPDDHGRHVKARVAGRAPKRDMSS
jgi:hypothetical protein